MKKIISNYYDIARRLYKEEGAVVVSKRAAKKISYKVLGSGGERRQSVKDILFINGCDIKYCQRYRVAHPMEQLEFNNLSSDEVFYTQVTEAMVKNYRGFVFYRCPITPELEKITELAKKLNKRCFFSIDDLVIDTKYTNQINEVQSMNAQDRLLYDDGVNRMNRMMKLCDYAIVTTEKMAEELADYKFKDIFINRNVMSEEMVRISNELIHELIHSDEANNEIIIGYFSGSITHSADFKMVLPSLTKILNKYKNTKLKIAGLLDVPAELKPFEDRIIRMEFKSNWRELPAEIAQCDIVLSPIVDTIFNQAKSEIKWLEASLAKVPVVASNLGAFAQMVRHKQTGLLAENTDESWFENLEFLVKSQSERRLISSRAYVDVIENYTSSKRGGSKLAKFMNSKLAKNIAFVLPTMNISGGIIVAMKHAEILQANGYDVSIINRGSTKKMDFGNLDNYSLFSDKTHKINVYFGNMVATLWDTLYYIRSYENKGQASYFVQNYETDFYAYGDALRKRANSTYSFKGVNYYTMSKWCQGWLKDIFGQESMYAPNGLESGRYPITRRDFSGKIKILVEGDSESEYKKVDESFEIINELDADRFEVTYLSYNGQPKSWYKVDKFHNRVPASEVGHIYADNDILIKSSILESFSYPPLEMMATGGIAILAPNDGNAEYAKDGENCVQYTPGDIKDAVAKIENILKNKNFRNQIINGGLIAADEFSWKNQEAEILKLYK